MTVEGVLHSVVQLHPTRILRAFVEQDASLIFAAALAKHKQQGKKFVVNSGDDPHVFGVLV